MKRVNFKELNETAFDVAIHDLLTRPNGYKAQSKQFDEINQWLTDNDIKALVGVMYATFYNKDDAFAFRMRWA